MSFLTLLFALLGFTLDVQPYTPPASQGGTQIEHGGYIIIGGSEGDAQPDQDDGAQGGTQAEVGGYIIING